MVIGMNQLSFVNEKEFVYETILNLGLALLGVIMTLICNMSTFF